jgi:hypothetical protein
MNYRVVWRSRSFNYLRVLHFMTLEMSGDVAALERAWDEIELALSDRPDEVGESRDGNERVFIANPLTVVYEAFPDQSTMLIYRLVHHACRAGNG